MPVVQPVHVKHRELAPAHLPPWVVCVARPVGKKEIKDTPAAQAALAKEWERLRKAGCWDEASVCEWDAVAAQARREGKKAHVGRIFELCVEKGSELPAGHPERRFKGRVVF